MEGEALSRTHGFNPRRTEVQKKQAEPKERWMEMKQQTSAHSRKTRLARVSIEKPRMEERLPFALAKTRIGCDVSQSQERQGVVCHGTQPPFAVLYLRRGGPVNRVERQEWKERQVVATRRGVVVSVSAARRSARPRIMNRLHSLHGELLRSDPVVLGPRHFMGCFAT
jgi:hypothetical protein